MERTEQRRGEHTSGPAVRITERIVITASVRRDDRPAPLIIRFNPGPATRVAEPIRSAERLCR